MNLKKMKYLILITIVFIPLYAPAQDCNQTALLQKPGTWKESSGGLSGVAAADLAKEKKVVAAIHSMVKSKYSPRGVNANYNGGYQSPQSNMPGNGYSYSIIPLNFYCDGKTVKEASGTSTHFSISANMFDAEIYDPAQGDRLLAEGFNVMNDMPIEKDGYWYFKDIDASLGFGITGKTSTWLITYDGKLPFAYVTKKEFLEKRKINLSNARLSSVSASTDVLKRIEIEKGYKEAEYKNDPEKLKRYMKMDYLSTKERYEKLIADNDKEYKPAFEKIEAQLKMPPNELTKLAIVKQDPNDYLSYLFTDDEDPFGKILIKPNSGYFNNKLPKSSPQFFWIYVRGSHQEPIATQFMTDIIKAIDFAVLKNMLGK